MPDWMLYGAYGYTGELTARAAVARGHRPLLAGRSREKLEPLAEELGLEHVTVALDEPAELIAALDRVRLVLNHAGPFVQTAPLMVSACLAARTHYLDITGELLVFEDNYLRDEKARANGIAIISGVGFDVVPTDCLAVYVADQVPDATHLAIAFATRIASSSGTVLSSLGSVESVGMVRRVEGQYTEFPMGEGVRTVTFPQIGERQVMPIPWGDLATAYRATGIPNITTYMALPPRIINTAKAVGGPVRALLRGGPLRDLAVRWVKNNVSGPDEYTRQTTRSYVWAQAAGASGQSVEAWLETIEAYRMTAEASLNAVERVLAAGDLSGTLTPAQAFGADFVLDLPETTRYDSLPS